MTKRFTRLGLAALLVLCILTLTSCGATVRNELRQEVEKVNRTLPAADDGSGLAVQKLEVGDDYLEFFIDVDENVIDLEELESIASAQHGALKDYLEELADSADGRELFKLLRKGGLGVKLIFKGTGFRHFDIKFDAAEVRDIAR